MKVKDLMTAPVVTVRETSTLDEVARTMLEHRIGCVPVVDESGRLKGIITESDFMAAERYVPFSTFRAPQLLGQWVGRDGLECIYREARTRHAREIMKLDVATVTDEQSLEDVVGLMLRRNLKRIPVVRDGTPIGVVARHDLLRAVATRLRGAGGDGRVSESSVPSTV